MSDISVLGIFVADISFSGDKIPITGETILGDSYNIGPGGKGCNQAIAISRLGGKVNFISKLGNDEYGKLAINKLKKDQIKLDADFYVFTGSSVGVVPILGKGFYKGTINKIGSVTSRIS